MPKKAAEKKPSKSAKPAKKVNFNTIKDETINENKNILKENYPNDGNLNLDESELEKETEVETEIEQEELEEEPEEEQEEDEDHEIEDEIEYDDENIEDIDDLYDEDKPKSKKVVKSKKKKLPSETEQIEDEDLEIDNEYCEYDYNEIYDEKKEEPTVIVDNIDRITLPKLTKYERVRLIGTRAKQISLGAKVMVKNTVGLNPIEIAKLELEYKMIPMKIKRILPDNKVEIWKLSELELDN